MKDTVWVEITLEKEKKMIIGGIYRSPNNNNNNNKLLFETIYSASQLNPRKPEYAPHQKKNYLILE